MSAAIEVIHVSKWFRRAKDRPTSLKEAVVKGLQSFKRASKFYALDDVSFSVEPGSMLGIIGENGAGKSTLLRLIGGVGQPNQGAIRVQGRIGALLDLGAGFHPDLTGRENVFISGVITGLTRQQVRERFEEIVDFAELHDFIDSPLRTYSTGMQMRLAFAVAAHIEPEILLVDEVLAVGDLAFQHKCLQRIQRFKQEGVTIVLVSHDISSIRQLCDDVIWLRHGKIEAHGPTEVVVGEYVAEMTAETRKRTPAAQPVDHTTAGIPLVVNQNRFGSQEVTITNVVLLGAQGLPASEIDSGDSLTVEIHYQSQSPIERPIFGVTLTREDGFVCYDSSSEASSLQINTLHGKGMVTLLLDRLDLTGGQYYVDVGIYRQDWSYAYDYHWHVYPLTIRPTKGVKGVIRPPARWQSTISSAEDI
ncbi:MAG: ABC transporter ATP-binding protein [Chloroflexi bacterium]|nr:ABC transporter ATP-binding protein [Chloroflexota bacterium]